LNRNIIRTLFLTLGAISSLLLLIAGIGGYFITGQAPIDDWGKWVKPTDEAVSRLDEEIAALEDEIDEAVVGEYIALELTEEEATSKLDQLARAGNLSIEIEDPQIYFRDEMVRAFAIVKMGIDVQVAIQAKIGINGEKPDITIESLNLGRIPIPKALINSMITAIERALEERWEDLHLLLQEVTIEQGEIMIVLAKN
jgi:hypothetical protein